jgi:DNA (cytosine-5)-methyltransferase 1
VAGGLDIGFHRAGFEIVACVEIEEAYCETLRANVGRGREFGANTEVICSDIRDIDPNYFTDRGIDCVIGGPPCQTFSAAGRRAGGVIGTADDRGQLFEAYCDVLRAVRPRAFVFENVYGLLGANGGGPWREIVAAFSELGFELTAEVVDAADYGVPQHRERLIMVGHTGSYKFPMPTHGPDSRTDEPLVGVQDAIADLQDPSEAPCDGPGGLYGHLLPQVPPGLNYAFFTAEMSHPEPVFAWRSKFHDLLYKVDPTAPCRTIKARPGKFTGPFHWNNRHFTREELKRLQSFPDVYELIGSDKRALEQIGNSVPPRLANVVATSVREQLYTRPRRLTHPVRPPKFKSTFRQRQREKSKRFKEIATQEIARVYGVRGDDGTATASPYDERYHFLEEDQFARKIFPKGRRAKGEERLFRVSITDSGSTIRIDARRLGISSGERRKARVEITGLSKYLGRIAEVEADAVISTPEDVFSLWWVIEKAMIDRSRFFTLIDIYGHYANRGDCVRIKAKYDLDPDNSITSGLAIFGQSENCGYFVRSKEANAILASKGGEADLEGIVAALRKVRFDIRTGETHPIIGRDRILCAYPFPLLSQKAMVESRALLDGDRLDGEADWRPDPQLTLF